MVDFYLPLLLVLTGAVILLSFFSFLVLIFHKRTRKKDKATYILIATLLMEFFFNLLNFHYWHTFPERASDGIRILEMDTVLSYILFQSFCLLYPLEILKPQPNFIRRITFTISPFVILTLIYYVCDFTPVDLYSSFDIIRNISEGEVRFKLACLSILIPYSAILPVIQFTRTKLTLEKVGLFIYTISIIIMNLLMSMFMISSLPHFYLVYLFITILVNVYLLYYEIRIRPDGKAIPGEAVQPESPALDATGSRTGDPLFAKVNKAMAEERIFTRQHLDINSLAKELGTNKTYLQRSIKHNTGYTFSEYINKIRIDYVRQYIDNNPNADLKSLFITAGYSSRTTAWRNFRAFVGCSPKEYQSSKRIGSN